MDFPFDDFESAFFGLAPWSGDDMMNSDSLGDLSVSVQPHLSRVLSEAMSLLPWALHNDNEKLIWAVEDFIAQATPLRRRHEQHAAELELRKEKRELAFSEEPHADRAMQKRPKVLPPIISEPGSAPVTVSKWDFQLVRAIYHNVVLFHSPVFSSFFSSQLPNVVNIVSVNEMPLSLQFHARPSKMGNHPAVICVANENVLLALDNAASVSTLLECSLYYFFICSLTHTHPHTDKRDTHCNPQIEACSLCI